MSAFSIKFDFKPAEVLAGKVERLASAVLTRIAAAEVVNDVVTRWQPQFRREMNAGLNLSDQYIAERMRSTPASAAGAGAVRSEVAAAGPRAGLTIMSRYPFTQLRDEGTVTRSGATAGRRPSGVRVNIKKGAAVTEPQWFTMRLRAGSRAGDKIGVFMRTTASGGKPVHLYGVSPYSLFRHQIDRLGPDLEADLATTAASRMAGTIEKALA